MLILTWLLAARGAEGQPEPAPEPAPSAPPSAPPESVPESAPETVPEGARMVGHFVEATTIMLAVAVGRVDVARDHALALAETEHVPPQLAAVAREVADCKKVSCAAPAVGKLGGTCADCHLESGRGPLPHDMGTIPGKDARERHIYAATFAWVGLVTPKQPTLLMGLSNVVPPVDRTSEPPKVAEAGETFKATIEQAIAAGSLEDRSVAFGRVLEACEGCHELAIDPREREAN